MSKDLTTICGLMSRPGVLALHGNRTYTTESGLQQVTMRRQPSGHMVFYRADGRRILMTDPNGNPLHECEWSLSDLGPVRLVSARLYLDWGQWVGIKPNGLVNRNSFDLSSRPGWQQITRQDLRGMASQIMGVPLSEVEFFYGDDDLTIEPTGQATIRQRKDAFYVLKDGRFEEAQFMSCMSAMHWDKIDYLPVVELFLSLLPGTGSAAFEFIRGLYDDQNPGTPRPLTYRGIPTYPSQGAFGLFSNFFKPTHPSGQQLFEIFMDPSRSHEISWLPNPDPPHRYIDSDKQFGLTVKKGMAQKVTLINDSTGLSFTAPNPQGFAASGKSLEMKNNTLLLQDQDFHQEISINPQWGIKSGIPSQEMETPSVTWRSLFPEGAPSVNPGDAFSAVLLYPEDDAAISEWSSQPFVADYLDDVLEQDERLVAHRASCSKVLVHGFDSTIGTCLTTDLRCEHTILFSHEGYAQKHAQVLWNQLARKKE
ncbi:MAG: hypothetical protein VST68_07115, partial [Nitrospirota bacterium]|nr:hypothetical protein [Nitrospirota bacterium]